MSTARPVVLVGVLLAVAACGGGTAAKASRPATPGASASEPSTSPASARTRVAGFGEIAYTVRGISAVRCALLADTEPQRQQGLMNRTDLAGHDGMLFRFPADTTVSFYMKDTLLPLSIAWFGADGRFVSATDMDPCLGRGDNCPLYPAARPYRYALEVPRGGLAGLGIGPGSTLTLKGACP